MFSKYDNKVMGFGNTEAEALYELNLNKSRLNIEHDVTGEFKKRRQELYSWLPLPTLLSIKGLTCIKYDKTAEVLINTSNNRVVKIEASKKLSHYLYLYYLLGDVINFEDFTITIGPEVNKFLHNVSPDIGTLDDFPYIKPGSMSQITSMHEMTCGAYICETRNDSLVICYNRVIEINNIDGVDTDCLIAYGLAKLGVMYNGENVMLC